jgi:KEOPS complex subunit Cgi121
MMPVHEILCDIRQAGITIPDRAAFLNRLKEIASGTGTQIVCFNANAMAGRAHVLAALSHARRSFEGGSPIANSFEMEALLYASGSRQCSEAGAFSISAGPNRAYVCICPESATAVALLAPFMTWLNEDWETITPEKKARLMQLFSITPEELGAAGDEQLQALVLERVVLLEVYR